MSNIKIRVVLQGNAKYRDGKKWKKRYCLLSLSSKNPYAMHLYMAKTYDDFAPYRNEGCAVDVQLTSVNRNYDFSSLSNCLNGSHDVFHTERGLCHLGAMPDSLTSHRRPPAQPLINTASQSCLAAAEATLSGLSAASALATRLNAPLPLDEIAGFESGYHMDKESNIVVLIGTNSVYIFALQGTDEMFRWAEAMSQIMTDHRFRVTLRKSTEGSKLSQGIQGSLHVQRWRLCLIGEPSAGCKFICSWSLDSVLKAYTMTLPAGTSALPDSQSGSIIRKTFTGENTHRISFGNLSLLSNACASSHSIGTQPNKPKNVFILEADHNAGRGRGTHTFELDAGLLSDLTSAIGQFMDRRFEHHSAYVNHTVSVHEKSDDIKDVTLGGTFGSSSCQHAVQARAPDMHLHQHHHHQQQQPIASSVANPSTSLARTFSEQTQSTGEFAPRSNPLPVPMTGSNTSHSVTDQRVFGLSVPITLPSNRFSSHQYSNLLPLVPPASPLDRLTDLGNQFTHISMGTADLEGGPNSVENRRSLNTACTQRVDESHARSNLRLEDSTSQSIDPNSKPSPHFTPLASAVNYPAVYCNCQLTGGVTAPMHMTYCPVAVGPSARLSTERSADSHLTDECVLPPPSSFNVHNVLDDMYSANEETQVARVAAGLVISKWPATTRQTPASPVLSNRHSIRCPNESVPTSTANTNFVAVQSTSENTSARTPCSLNECRSGSHSLRPCQYHKHCVRMYQQHRVSLENNAKSLSGATPEPSNVGFRCVMNSRHSSNGLVQHGVFRADEDLSDTEQVASRKSVDVAQHKVDKIGQDGSSHHQTGLWHNLGERDFRELTNYPLYHHRHRQYRACCCLLYAGRSLSADLLFRLYRNGADKADALHVCKSKEALDGIESGLPLCHATTPSVAIAFDRHPHPVTSNSLKAFRGTRWRNIHRLFHRKHSKSHDNLQHHCRFPESWCSTGKTAVSTSVTEDSLEYNQKQKDTSSIARQALFDIQNALWSPDCTSSTQARCHMIWCSRHGFRPYQTWFRIFHSPSSVPLCPHCRRKKEPPTPVTCAKSIQRCGCHNVAGVTAGASSVLSTLRNLVNPRYKLRGSGFSLGRVCVRRRISAPAKEVPRASTVEPAIPSGARSLRGASFSIRPHNHPPHVSVVDSSQSRNVATPIHLLGVRNSRTTHCVPFDYERRCQSALSLTSLTCSEPTLPTSGCPFRRLPLATCSLHSSLSSLPTSPSISGSSSLLSGSLGVANLFTKKHVSRSYLEAVDAADLESSDPVVVTQGSSFCETDGLSSGSLSAYCDDARSNERHSAGSAGCDVTKNLYVDCSPLKTPFPASDSYNHFTCRESELTVPCDDCIVCHSKPGLSHSTWHSEVAPLSVSKSSLSIQFPPDQKIHFTHTHAFNPEPFGFCGCTNNLNRMLVTKRSNTLPTSRVVRSFSERETVDPVTSTHGQQQQFKTTVSSTDPRSSKIRFVRKGRRNPRYNTATSASIQRSDAPLDRKLSYQSGVGATSYSPDPISTTEQHTAYCNLKPLQRASLSTNAVGNSASVEAPHTSNQRTDRLPLERTEVSQSIYVNLPLVNMEMGNSVGSYSSQKGRPAHHVLHALHHGSSPMASGLNTKVVAIQSPSSCSFVGVLEPSTGGTRLPKPTLPDTMVHHINAASRSHSVITNPSMCLCGPPVFSLPAYMTSGGGLTLASNMSHMPAEVRDPTRNYAMVDLRPSPASSVNANTELTLGIVHCRPHSAHTELINSANSSGGSVIGFSNSTSTGSDCASDAATLISDTLGSYAAVCTTAEAPASSRLLLTGTQSTAPVIETTRRRHSHSLSSAMTEAPVLNYVHVIASTAPMTTPNTARRDEYGSTVSDAISGYTIPEHADSPSSSSGLGGIASQSVTPPLAPTGGASLRDIFTSRSMTSSATSSGEGNQADPGFHSYSPLDDDYVAYTQIDFTRTLALGEVHGDMEQHESGDANKSHGHLQWYSLKPDRSVRKSLARPIRSIRRSNQKKSSS